LQETALAPEGRGIERGRCAARRCARRTVRVAGGDGQRRGPEEISSAHVAHALLLSMTIDDPASRSRRRQAW
jgi:hypothetical protein